MAVGVSLETRVLRLTWPNCAGLEQVTIPGGHDNGLRECRSNRCEDKSLEFSWRFTSPELTMRITKMNQLRLVTRQALCAKKVWVIPDVNASRKGIQGS